MKSKLMKAIGLALAVVLILGIAACSPKDPETNKDTLIFGVAREPSGLDPHQLAETIAFNVTCAIYDCLVKDNGSGEYVPHLAESVDVSDDGMTYTFKLRQGVEFSNGTPVTPEDVKFSLDRTKAKGWAFDMTRYIDEVEVVGDDTVVVYLNAPFNGLLGSLASPYFSIMSKAYVEEVGDDMIKRQPIGSGPFILSDWVSGDHLELVANENYFDEKPFLKKVIYKVVSDKSTAVMALESGELDLYDDVDVNDIAMIKANPDLQFQSTPKAGVLTMCINNEVEPLNDIRVRQAIAYALNRDDIVTGVYQGYSQAADSPIPPSCEGYSTNVKQFERDIQKAKDLLAEAGYPNGLTITMSIQAPYRPMAEVIQANLKEVGITLKIDILEPSAFSSTVYAEGNYEVCIRGWIAMFPDAYSMLYCQYHEDCYGPTGNISHIRDKVLNQLLDNAAVTSAEDKVAAYDEVVAHIRDNAYEMPLVVNFNNVAANAKLKGLHVPPIGIYDMTKLYFE